MNKEYDHEETDSQEFQDEYRRARIAEEVCSLFGGKCDSFRPATNMTKIKEKFMHLIILIGFGRQLLRSK